MQTIPQTEQTELHTSGNVFRGRFLALSLSPFLLVHFGHHHLQHEHEHFFFHHFTHTVLDRIRHIELLPPPAVVGTGSAAAAVEEEAETNEARVANDSVAACYFCKCQKSHLFL